MLRRINEPRSPLLSAPQTDQDNSSCTRPDISGLYEHLGCCVSICPNENSQGWRMHREDRFIDCDWNGSALTTSIGFTGSVSGVHGRYQITWSNGCVFSPLGPLPKCPSSAASKTGTHIEPIAPAAPTRSDDPTT